VGKLTRAPYKLVWDLRTVPPQFFSGATLLADAEFLNGERQVVREEGVFLVHDDVEAPEAFVHTSGKLAPGRMRDTIALHGRDQSRRAYARVQRDRHRLVFSVTVADPRFSENAPREQLAATGCEILIDAAVQTRPFPSDSTLAVFVPLQGEPTQRHFTATFGAEGRFAVSTRTSPYEPHTSLKTADGRGWKIVCVVPPSLLGQGTRRTVRCNVVATIALPDGGMSRLTWTGRAREEVYSPVRWGVLHLAHTPLLARPSLLFVFAFCAGLALMLIVPVVLPMAGRPTGMVLTFEDAAGEQKVFDLMRVFTDRQVPNKDATVEDLVNEFSIDAKRIDRLFRKYTGYAYQTFITRMRIAVAKERLRSSNASEASVAEMCGFRSVQEMERMFLRYSRVTPYKYRMEQQVT
jgi:AraC-like DNA-binding protein